MIVTGSSDISSLQCGVVWDISGTQPTIGITNLSSGTGLASCTWWFIAKSPSGTLIHEGSALTPDETGDWTSALLTDNWPKPFNSIEWSGAAYLFQLYVKDSAGNIYSIDKIASICRPAGNVPTSKNPYGLASVDLQVKCQQARIWFEDITNHVYKGMEGTQITSVLKVVYPIDETGIVPDPFVLSNFSTALVPISYSSDNYQFVFSTVYEYDLGDYSYVRIKYQSRSSNGAFAVSFAVLCNIDLMPLVCEYVKLIDEIENGNCTDVVEANRKLSLINSKMMLVNIGIQQPLTGVDVPVIIKEIETIGGFTCDCCNAATGIIPNTASIIDGYTFSIVPVCGDINGTVTTVGTNIQFNLQDKSYVFAIYPESPADTTAFTILPQLNGCTKTYYLRVDGVQLATDILNIIKTDSTLVNLFNSIVNNGGSGSGQLIVDGGCIFQSSSTCDYAFELQNIPINTTFSILSGIKIGSTTSSLSFAFNLTNLPALQTYLNGIGYGSFIVTNPVGQQVSITSAANQNDIQQLTYKISGTTFIAGMQKDCTGYIAIDANEVVQNIINYLCAIDDSQIVTSQDYTITYVDSAGDIQTTLITAGNPLSTFLSQLLTLGATTINNIGTNISVSCDSVKGVFGTNGLLITGNDFIAGTKGGGACSKVNYLEAFAYMLSAGISNASVKQLFCEFVISCGAGLSCNPYDYFNVLVTNYNSTCVEIVGIDYVLT